MTLIPLDMKSCVYHDAPANDTEKKQRKTTGRGVKSVQPNSAGISFPAGCVDVIGFLVRIHAYCIFYFTFDKISKRNNSR